VNGLLPFPGFFENLVLITNALKWLWNEFWLLLYSSTGNHKAWLLLLPFLCWLYKLP
jgi:hypothetical protein